jgi:hypothetical protein
MKKLLVLLVALMVLGVAFADVSFSGGVDVSYTLTSTPLEISDSVSLTLDRSVSLTWDRIEMTASGDGYYLSVIFDDGNNTFSIDQAYMTFTFDPVTLYVGEKGYWLNPYAFTDGNSLTWNHKGVSWDSPKAYLGAKVSFDMGSVYVTVDPRYEEGKATPTVNVFGNVSFDPVSLGFIAQDNFFDPVSLGFIAQDNFKELGLGVTVNVAPVTASAAFGYSIENSTITALLVGVNGTFDPVSVLGEVDLTDFNAIVVNGIVNYTINDKMDAGLNAKYNLGDKSFGTSAWFNYYYNDNITLTPSVSFDGEVITLNMNAHFDF